MASVALGHEHAKGSELDQAGGQVVGKPALGLDLPTALGQALAEVTGRGPGGSG